MYKKGLKNFFTSSSNLLKNREIDLAIFLALLLLKYLSIFNETKNAKWIKIPKKNRLLFFRFREFFP